MQLGPCCICGLRDYAESMGGPTICPTCDTGYTGVSLVKAQKKRIEELEEKLKMNDLKDVLKSMKESQARWCTDEVDDPEEMWTEYPEFLNRAIPILESCLKENVSS